MGTLAALTIVLVALAGVFYQVFVVPFVETIGLNHEIEPLNNQQCSYVPELEGCESNVLLCDNSFTPLADLFDRIHLTR